VRAALVSRTAPGATPGDGTQIEERAESDFQQRQRDTTETREDGAVFPDSSSGSVSGSVVQRAGRRSGAALSFRNLAGDEIALVNCQ